MKERDHKIHSLINIYINAADLQFDKNGDGFISAAEVRGWPCMILKWSLICCCQFATKYVDLIFSAATCYDQSRREVDG